MLNRANLKDAATMASPAISFPPNTAQRWTLANGLTLIVQEDRSAPVASVQAWCAMGMDDPDRTITQLLFATAYQRHPYRLPVIGLIDIYNHLTQEQVMEYYKTRYVPNNLTFIVVGDVVAAEVWKKLEDLFKDQPA